MRKILLGAAGLALVAGFALAPNAQAEPSDACGDAPVTNEGDPASGSGSLTVCVTEGPVTGNGTAAGDANSGEGYVVADGDSTNEGALVGYIGIQTGDDGTPEGTSSGCPAEYEAGEGETTDAEETVEFIQAGGESECDPETGEPVE